MAFRNLHRVLCIMKGRTVRDLSAFYYLQYSDRGWIMPSLGVHQIWWSGCRTKIVETLSTRMVLPGESCAEARGSFYPKCMP